MRNAPVSSAPISLRGTIASFILLQLMLATGIFLIASGLRESASLADITGSLRLRIAALDFHFIDWDPTAPEAQARQDHVKAFRASLGALQRGGEVTTLDGRKFDISPLSCDSCQQKLRHIDADFESLLNFGWQITDGGIRRAPVALTLELRKREQDLVFAISQLNREIAEENIWQIRMSLAVILLAGLFDVALFAAALRGVRRQRRAALESARTLSLLATNTRNMVIYTAPDKRITWVNAAFTKEMGFTLEESVGRTINDLLGGPESDKQLIDWMDRELREVGHIESYKLLNYRKDGSTIWAAIDADRVLDDEGNASNFIWVQTDVSQQMQQQAELVERDALQRALIDTAHNAIVVMDDHGVIELFNPAAEKIFGYPAAYVQGRSIDLLLPTHMRGAAHAARVRGFAEGERTSSAMGEFTVKGVRADATEVPLLASIAKLSIKGKTRYVAILMDVSAQFAIDSALREKEVAHLANQAKTKFLATMSHELRTPLNAIVGYADLMSRLVGDKDDQRFQQYTRSIRQASDHLGELVNDVLDLATIESGSIRLQMMPLPLACAVTEAVALHRTAADTAGISLNVLAPDEPLVVNADRKRMQQVLSNLISNAIKYNQHGGTVVIQLAADGHEVLVDIADNGEGMNEEQLAHLFEPFNRLGAERSGIQGTGIGLALVKEIVNAMSGRIVVSSQPGKGSTFTVTFPRVATPAEHLHGHTPAQAPDVRRPAEVPTGAAPSTTQRILYVEDSLANVELMREIVRLTPGYQLTAAPDGDTAIRYANSMRFDLALVDMNLPDMPGTDVLRALRRIQSTSAVPIFALSADVTPDNIKAALAAGFDDYLTKPIDIDAFLQKLETSLTPPQAPETQRPEAKV